MFDYEVWKGRVPIECAVNAALLYNGERDVVQFDVTYYDSPEERLAVESLAHALREDGCVDRYDASGNIVLYLKRNAAHVEASLLQQTDDGTVEGGFRTTAFARLLDPHFYCCTHDLTEVFAHTSIVRASIDVVHAGRSGALVVQMLHPTTARENVGRMHARFETLTRCLERLDPSLHTTFTLYTKPGGWKTPPEYVARHMTAL